MPGSAGLPGIAAQPCKEADGLVGGSGIHSARRVPAPGRWQRQDSPLDRVNRRDCSPPGAWPVWPLRLNFGRRVRNVGDLFSRPPSRSPSVYGSSPMYTVGNWRQGSRRTARPGLGEMLLFPSPGRTWRGAKPTSTGVLL